jgi:hypothetical protein
MVPQRQTIGWPPFKITTFISKKTDIREGVWDLCLVVGGWTKN